MIFSPLKLVSPLGDNWKKGIAVILPRFWSWCVPTKSRVVPFVTRSSICMVDSFTVAESMYEKSSTPSEKKSDPIWDVVDSHDPSNRLLQINRRKPLITFANTCKSKAQQASLKIRSTTRRNSATKKIISTLPCHLRTMRESAKSFRQLSSVRYQGSSRLGGGN